MSMRYKGATLSSTAPVTTGGESGTAPGAWTLEQQAQAQAAGLWPIPPQPKYVEDVFSTYLYTGNSSTQTITNGIDLAGKGGLVWLKGRSLATGHYLYDTVRGIANGPLSSENTNAAYTANTPKTLTTFNSNGFSMQDDSATFGTNVSPRTYVSWTFREQAKFFDVVTYTGNGVSGRQIAHNLGSTPGFVVVKNITNANSWYCWHRSLPNSGGFLETTDAFSPGLKYICGTVNDTVFSVDSAGGSVNGSGENYVAYLFAHNAGGFGALGTDNVISCGTCSSDGSGYIQPVNLGYEPQWVMLKRTNSTGNWVMMDTMRGMANTAAAASPILLANTSAAEAATGVQVNPIATGFEDTLWGGWGASNTYIYIAIRRGPMKVPTLGTSVFTPVSTSGNVASITAGFPVDFALGKEVKNSTGYGNYDIDRLRGGSVLLETNTTGAEYTSQTFKFDSNTQFLQSAGGLFYGPSIYWLMRRAPSFFDEVCFNGPTSGSTTQTHNLAVVPELMIVRPRSVGSYWYVYSASLGISKYLALNLNDAQATSSNFWVTAPTSTAFTCNVDNMGSSGANRPHVAYLFGTCAGVSKVGSYTGNGTTQTINCGFTGGARFVLIKRTDSTGDWYVWDSARGIVSGNDSYILLNSTAAEVTGTDYVDTAATGFEISSTAPAAINASGGSFIFLAIA